MSNRAIPHEYRVEVFRDGRRVRNIWYATWWYAYVRAVFFLDNHKGDYVQVSRNSKLLARMVRPT